MKLTFRLRYHTHLGQSLWLDYSLADGAKTVPLGCRDEGSWQVSMELPADAAKGRMTYHYILRNPDGSQIMDQGDDSAPIPAAFHGEEVLVLDSWNDLGAVANAFYTEPFKAVLLNGNRTGRAIDRPARRDAHVQGQGAAAAQGPDPLPVGGRRGVGQLGHGEAADSQSNRRTTII